MRHPLISAWSLDWVKCTVLGCQRRVPMVLDWCPIIGVLVHGIVVAACRDHVLD